MFEQQILEMLDGSKGVLAMIFGWLMIICFFIAILGLLHAMGGGSSSHH